MEFLPIHLYVPVYLLCNKCGRTTPNEIDSDFFPQEKLNINATVKIYLLLESVNLSARETCQMHRYSCRTDRYNVRIHLK